jgi:hypothetical protein
MSKILTNKDFFIPYNNSAYVSGVNDRISQTIPVAFKAPVYQGPRIPIVSKDSLPGLHGYILIHQDVGMKLAEVEVNKRISLMVNDKEHKAFKLRCVRDNREMSEVIRELMREYVSRKKA